MDKNLGQGHWMETATRGEFEGKSIKSIDTYPGWDKEERANYVRFEFTDGTSGDLLIFYRGYLGGESPEDE